MLSVTRNLLLPCFGFAFSLLPPLALAQSPKAPPAAPSPSVLSLELPGDDARLSKPCHLSCDAAPMRDILAQLAKETGVEFRIEGKWVEDLPTYAYTHPMPLHLLMQRLASLHNLTWRREPAQPSVGSAGSAPNAPPALPVYALYQSGINKGIIASLKQQKWNLLRQHVADFRRTAGLPAKTLKDLADTGDKVARDMLDPRTRAGIVLIAAVPDAMLEDLIQKHTATFTFAQLAPSCQEALALLAQRNEAQQAAARAQDLKPGETPAPLLTPDKYAVRYFVQDDGKQANLRTMILHPNGYFTGPEPFYPGYSGQAEDWSRQRYAAGQAGVAPPNRLEARQTPDAITFEGYALRNALQTVCDKWNLNVFCDAYPDDPGIDTLPSPLPQYYPARTLLSDAVGIFSLWDRRMWQEGAAGSDLLLLKGDWYARRDEGQTDAVMARLKATKAQNVPFSLEDWAEMIALPDVAAPRIEATLKVSLSRLEASREILRFYNDLRLRERQRLLKEGLTYAELSGVTQEKLLLTAQAGDVALTAAQVASARLRVRVELDASIFALQIESPDGVDSPRLLRQWRVRGAPRGMSAASVQPVAK